MPTIVVLHWTVYPAIHNHHPRVIAATIIVVELTTSKTQTATTEAEAEIATTTTATIIGTLLGYVLTNIDLECSLTLLTPVHVHEHTLVKYLIFLELVFTVFVSLLSLYLSIYLSHRTLNFSYFRRTYLLILSSNKL